MPKAQFKVSKHYTFTCPPPYRSKFEFWAENGFVRVLSLDKAADSSVAPEDTTVTLYPKEFYKRAVALYCMTRDYADEQFAVERFREQSKLVAHAALRQNAMIETEVSAGFKNRIVVSQPITPASPTKLLLPPSAEGARSHKPAKFAKQNPWDLMSKGIKYV